MFKWRTSAAFQNMMPKKVFKLQWIKNTNNGKDGKRSHGREWEAGKERASRIDTTELGHFTQQQPGAWSS